MLNPIAVVVILVILVAAIDAARWVYLFKQDPHDRKHPISVALTEWWFDRVMGFFRR